MGSYVEKQKFIPDFIIYTDGGCAYNPGGQGGIGAVIIDAQTNEIIKKLFEGYRSTTNNRMEIRAALTALSFIENNSKCLVITDSQYVVNCGNGNWDCNANLDLWTQMKNLKKEKHLKITFQWVHGHSGNKYNEMCDELATQGILSTDLKEDIGFNSICVKMPSEEMLAFKKKYIGGSMSIKIDVPEELKFYDISNIELRPHLQCSKLIEKANLNNNLSFKELSNLKTGGNDAFSSLFETDLLSIVDERVYQLVYSYFDDYRNTLSVLRWYLRGLNLEHAIRREFVHLELSYMIPKEKRKY